MKTLRLYGFAFFAVFILVLVGHTGFAAKSPSKTEVVDADADQAPTSETTPAVPKSKSKSAKKASADAVRIKPPQVLEEGDMSLGLHANQGGIYGGAPVVALNMERMVKPNFGVGVLVGYASYSTTLNAGPFSGELDSTVWTAALFGSLHADVFKVKNLDTFLTAGFAHAFFNSEWKSSDPEFSSPGVSAESATNFFIAYVNARYFIDSSWGFTASIGTGLGTLSLGLDYLF